MKDSVILRIQNSGTSVMSPPINSEEEWKLALDHILASVRTSYNFGAIQLARIRVHLMDLSLTDSEATPEHTVCYFFIFFILIIYFIYFLIFIIFIIIIIIIIKKR